MRFLHTADVHIQDESQLKTIDVIIDTAIEESCGVILIAGDLFDKDSSIFKIEGKLAAKLERFPGDIFVIAGNHDAEILRKRKQLARNTTVLDGSDGVVRMNLNGVQLIALPFREGRELKDYGDLQADPFNSILMVHGAFYSSSFFYDHSNRKSYFPIFAEDLRDKYRYVALGHYHRLIEETLGKTSVINPGSPRITRSSDLGKRRVSVVDTDDWSVKLIDLPAPYYFPVTLNIGVFDDTDRILSRLDQALSPLNNEEEKRLAILNLKVRGTLSPELNSPLTLRNMFEDKLKRAGYEYLEVNMDDLHGVYPELLDNPFVKKIIEESKIIAEQEGLDGDEAEKLAIDRLNALFT